MLRRLQIHPDDLLALDDALNKLYKEDKIAADLIKLRVFGSIDPKLIQIQSRVSKCRFY